MPTKRVSVAAGLKNQGPAQKTGRSSSGPLIACARRWGHAKTVFEGPLQQSWSLARICLCLFSFITHVAISETNSGSNSFLRDMCIFMFFETVNLLHAHVYSAPVLCKLLHLVGTWTESMLLYRVAIESSPLIERFRLVLIKYKYQIHDYKFKEANPR